MPWNESGPFELDPNLMQTDTESTSPDGPEFSQELFQENLDTFEDALVEPNANISNHTEQSLISQSPLSAGIQFRDLAHKFDSILTLC